MTDPLSTPTSVTVPTVGTSSSTLAAPMAPTTSSSSSASRGSGTDDVSVEALLLTIRQVVRDEIEASRVDGRGLEPPVVPAPTLLTPSPPTTSVGPTVASVPSAISGPVAGKLSSTHPPIHTRIPSGLGPNTIVNSTSVPDCKAAKKKKKKV